MISQWSPSANEVSWFLAESSQATHFVPSEGKAWSIFPAAAVPLSANVARRKTAKWASPSGPQPGSCESSTFVVVVWCFLGGRFENMFLNFKTFLKLILSTPFYIFLKWLSVTACNFAISVYQLFRCPQPPQRHASWKTQLFWWVLGL